MIASLVTRSQTWPLSAGKYQHNPKHPWVDGIQTFFFSPNFWSVARSWFEDPGMAAVLLSPLQVKFVFICGENMDFSVLKSRNICRRLFNLKHRDKGSSLHVQNVILLKLQMPQYLNCRQAPLYQTQYLIILMFLCSVH